MEGTKAILEQSSGGRNSSVVALRRTTGAVLPVVFRFRFEPILDVVARFETSIEGAVIREFGNRSLARFHGRRLDEP